MVKSQVRAPVRLYRHLRPGVAAERYPIVGGQMTRSNGVIQVAQQVNGS